MRLPVRRLHQDLISPAEAGTVPGLFERRCERTPRGEAYRQYDERSAQWRAFTWSEMSALAGRWQACLARLSLDRAERTAVLLRNSVEWVCFDLAAQALGLIVVPLYTNDSPRNMAHILRDSGARVLVLESADQWSGIAALRAQFPALAHVLCLQPEPPQPLEADIAWQPIGPWLAEAKGEFRSGSRDAAAIATLVYTSGTTGPAKGAMLSHASILWNAAAVLSRVPAYREDLFLSFLPLSHAFERTVGYYLPMMSGATVAFARSVQDLPEDLRRLRPTVLISVPRIYERAYARIQQELGARSGLARKLVRRSAELGWKRFEFEQRRGERLGIAQRLLRLVLQQLVARRILARLGGRLRVCVSGGAALAPELSRWLIGIGTPLLQGYGLTEAAPVVTANHAADNQPASVGVPLPGVQLRLGPGDEVLVKSPGVMCGYWERPEETGRAIDADGWLHTGDLGRLEVGHLYITGRIKEILVLSTAEKLAPTDLEMAITGDPLFEQAMVVGEGQPYPSALIVVNAVAWQQLCEELGLAFDDPAALTSKPALSAVLDRIAARLASFPSYAQVRRVWLSRTAWTIEAGLITPTMKLKREVLAQHFADRIEALYRAERETAGSAGHGTGQA
jgi:long-chain acyl-CoA synthetase